MRIWIREVDGFEFEFEDEDDWRWFGSGEGMIEESSEDEGVGVQGDDDEVLAYSEFIGTWVVCSILV